MSKIIQIGFSRCGTTSLTKYFQQNHYKTAHWNRGLYDRLTLAQIVYYNKQQNLPLLKNMDRITFFSDIQSDIINNKGETEVYCGYTEFITFDKQYPDSKFIFNTRNIDKWILSRKRHCGGTFLKHCCNVYKKTEIEIEDIWREHWHTHTENVKNYFQDKPNKLLHFQLEESSHVDLFNFFEKDFILNPDIQLKHLNATKREWV